MRACVIMSPLLFVQWPNYGEGTSSLSLSRLFSCDVLLQPLTAPANTRKIACKPRSSRASRVTELRRNIAKLSRDTISIPREPEPSSLARTRVIVEYVEFLPAMFVVGVHRGERAATNAHTYARVRAGDRPTHFREMRQNVRMPDTTLL